MAKFLSDDWFTQVEASVAEAGDLNAPATLADLVLNVNITGTEGGDVQMALNGGNFERGHVDGASTTITLPEELCRKIFIENDQSAGMSGFMSGQIKIDGDMSKLMAMQTVQPSAEQAALQAKILAFTD